MIGTLALNRNSDLKLTTLRRAFTLVEMLIAMAITLLLMAALAKAFGFVGESIRDSRGEVQLSSDLRDITSRLRRELDSMTVTFEPNSGGEDQRGYFLYYEGPVTDATSSIFGAFSVDGSVVRPNSRYGDFDDYLAFTAVAPDNHWFTGKVPRFLLDQKQAQVANPGLSPAIDPYVFDPGGVDPIVIRSKYAEIIYFASPEYDVATLPINPRYVDTDGPFELGSGLGIESGLPDRLRLHRRVLLIRPDLNMANGSLRPTAWNRNFNGVEFMLADTWPTASAATVRPEANPNDGWLYGMAGVHQQCDLSIRRVLGPNGLPTQEVAANTLEDLAKPHNRFAHVRVPGSLLGIGSNDITSMPVLALGPPATILEVLDESGDNRISPPRSNSGPSPVVTPMALSGFIRPEFVLGNNLTHRSSNLDLWGLERIGEDLVSNNLLGFDLKVYDPEAVSITSSQGLVLSTNDAGFRETLLQYIASPDPVRLMQGDFVDLAYPVLAGGSLRGWGPVRLDRLQPTASAGISPAASVLLTTPFSSLARFGNSQTSYRVPLYRSGKLFLNGATIRLFQPTYDTFSSHYERDGFLQGYENAALNLPPALYGGPGFGTRWVNSNNPQYVDWGSNGLDESGFFGPDDDSERETLAPFLTPASAIRVSVRLENRETRQVRQSSLVHRN